MTITRLTALADIATLTLARDTVRGIVAHLTLEDLIAFGDGAEPDTLLLEDFGVIDFRAGGNAGGLVGLERVELGAGANALFLTDAVVASAYAGTAFQGLLTVFGNSGDDAVDASAVAAGRRVVFHAGQGSDTFLGGAGNDRVRIDAAALTAADTFVGGLGRDTLTLATAGALAANAFAGVTGFDVIELNAGGNALTLAASTAATADQGVLSVISAGGDDLLDATAATGAMYYVAGAGIETYRGGSGQDRVLVTAATLNAGDRFDGGAGRALDVLQFGAGGRIAVDRLNGVTGFERISLHQGGNAVTIGEATSGTASGTLGIAGGAGNDTVLVNGAFGVSFTPGSGNDRFQGSAGNDTLSISPTDLTFADQFDGRGGTDTLVFTAAGVIAASALAGIAGFERIVLAPGGNTLELLGYTGYAVSGGGGNDVVHARPDSGDVSLGGGNDRLVVETDSDVAGNALRRSGGDGTDVLELALLAANAAITIGANYQGFEALRLTSAAAGSLASIDMTGAVGDWTITGSAARETVLTGEGSYVLDLGAAQDRYVVGGDGVVTITDSGVTPDELQVLSGPAATTIANLGAGNDTYLVRGGALVLITDFAGGNDTLDGRIGLATSSLIALLGDGNDTADLIMGPNSLVDMGAGDDTVTLLLLGAPGSTLLGGAGTDLLRLGGQPGLAVDLGAADQVVGGDSGALQTGFENVTLLSAGTVQLRAGAQIVNGSDGNDRFVVAAGSTGQVNGGGGNDTLQLGVAGTASIAASYSVSTGAGTSVSVSGVANLAGSAGADTLRGDAQVNTLSGGDGNDVIDGGGGADILFGGNGSDIFRFTDRSHGRDAIPDFDNDLALIPFAEIDVLQFSASAFPTFFSIPGVQYHGGATGVIPLGTDIVYMGTLDQSADIDALLAARALAFQGGMFAVVERPQPSFNLVNTYDVYYDPNAAVVGGGNAAIPMVRLDIRIFGTDELSGSNFGFF